MGEGNKGTEDSGLSTLQYFFFSSELIAAFKSEIMPNCDSKLKATSAQELQEKLCQSTLQVSLAQMSRHELSSDLWWSCSSFYHEKRKKSLPLSSSFRSTLQLALFYPAFLHTLWLHTRKAMGCLWSQYLIWHTLKASWHHKCVSVVEPSTFPVAFKIAKITETKLCPCGLKKEADNKDGKWECAQKEGLQTHGWVTNCFSHNSERSWTCSNLFTDSWF